MGAAPPKRRAPRQPKAPAEKPPRKPQQTKGEKAAARLARRKARRAHQAGLRAVRRERLDQAREWLWPPHTRDVGKGKAVALLVLNIVPFPGLGTALYGRPGRGLLQFGLTFLFLVGWLWAIADGVRIVQRAFGGPPRHDPPRRVDPSRTR